MAKSMRSKKEKRLRAIRREMVQPLYEKKDEAKFAALEAALNAPKLPVRTQTASMDVSAAATPTTTTSNAADMDVEMDEGSSSRKSLKPIGRRLKKKLKLSKRKYRGKGKIRKKNV